MSDEQKLAQLMAQAIWMLGHSVEDVRLGHYSTRERGYLADGLDQLSRALRDSGEAVVVNEEGRS